ncbi:hypothetical protein DOTSEDRAFT_37943 [Dothistroma septosporum NZE10]|uniref:Uncharacterized protein n=1 Tax=Dothistroma septosporum (strain NZE10 / CBS 128990) TaxID=675120 RepID=N1PF21_DOTSN|nr:hypothetical protein DOTSEDRAFT_37943 [Dothistroma septosporum NZE10]
MGRARLLGAHLGRALVPGGGSFHSAGAARLPAVIEDGACKVHDASDKKTLECARVHSFCVDKGSGNRPRGYRDVGLARDRPVRQVQHHLPPPRRLPESERIVLSVLRDVVRTGLASFLPCKSSDASILIAADESGRNHVQVTVAAGTSKTWACLMMQGRRGGAQYCPVLRHCLISTSGLLWLVPTRSGRIFAESTRSRSTWQQAAVIPRCSLWALGDRRSSFLALRSESPKSTGSCPRTIPYSSRDNLRMDHYKNLRNPHMAATLSSRMIPGAHVHPNRTSVQLSLRSQHTQILWWPAAKWHILQHPIGGDFIRNVCFLLQGRRRYSLETPGVYGCRA